MLRLVVRFLAKVAFAAGLLNILAACAAIDSVGIRAGAMDQSVARYRSEETLRNIVRASNLEPLNFSAISSVTGHNTVTLGLPSVTWNAPTRAPSETIGPSNAGYNFSNDFAWNQLDDNATTSALLTPLDASTMAIFFEYGYPPDWLLLLFIHHIQVRENVRGKANGPGSPGRVLHIFYSNRFGKDASVLSAYTFLADYLGLTFRFERATVPGQQKKPRSQMCFDPDTAKFVGNIDRIDRAYFGNKTPSHNAHLTTLLPSRLSLRTPDIDVLTIANCDKSASWLPASADSAATAATENYNCVSSICAPKKKPTPTPEASYRIYDPYDDVWLELFSRSTYNIYLFLGNLVDTRVRLLARKDGDDEAFTVIKGVEQDCFAEIDDREHYCVPRKATNTKMTFNLLHHLAALYTFPNTAPANSSTVRITP